MAHQFPFRTLPVIGEAPAGRWAEVIDDAVVFSQKGATAVDGLDGFEVVSVVGQIKIEFGALAFIQIEESSDRRQGLRREDDFARPSAADAAARAVTFIIPVRLKPRWRRGFHCFVKIKRAQFPMINRFIKGGSAHRKLYQSTCQNTIPTPYDRG